MGDRIPAWYLFAFSNLHLREVEVEGSPILPDASVFDRQSLLHFAKVYEINKTVPAEDRDRQDEAFVDYFLYKKQSTDDFFLAVRGKVDPEFSEKRMFNETAWERAAEVASLITFLVFVRSGFSVAAGLKRLVQGQGLTELVFAASLSDRHFSMSESHERAPHRGSGMIRMNAQNLQAELSGALFVDLRAFAARDVPDVASAVRESVGQAGKHLAEAILAVDPTHQVLAAVTAIEMLIAQGPQDGFAKLQERIVALVGADAAEKLTLPDIVDARNAYVHRGKRVPWEMGKPFTPLALRALKLALLALIEYARLAQKLGNREAITQHLDLVTRLNLSQAVLSEAERDDIFRRLGGPSLDLKTIFL